VNVIHVSFRLDGPNRDFDVWFLPLVAAVRTADGCVVYDYSVDSVDPRRRYIFEAWESQAKLRAHQCAAAHVEMLALGTTVYGMSDLQICSWTDAGPVKRSTRRRTDEHVDGRGHLDTLIAGVQSRYLDGNRDRVLHRPER
jgi:quinol monooxygenase YgiN